MPGVKHLHVLPDPVIARLVAEVDWPTRFVPWFMLPRALKISGSMPYLTL
jgi:hypothetical protein